MEHNDTFTIGLDLATDQDETVTYSFQGNSEVDWFILNVNGHEQEIKPIKKQYSVYR